MSCSNDDIMTVFGRAIPLPFPSPCLGTSRHVTLRGYLGMLEMDPLLPGCTRRIQRGVLANQDGEGACLIQTHARRGPAPLLQGHQDYPDVRRASITAHRSLLCFLSSSHLPVNYRSPLLILSSCHHFHLLATISDSSRSTLSPAPPSSQPLTVSHSSICTSTAIAYV